MANLPHPPVADGAQLARADCGTRDQTPSSFPGCNNQLLGWAARYAAAGLSLIPIQLDGTKAPAIAGWREYSDRRPTPAEWRRWFAGPRPYGIGIPGGPASGNLVVLDFESRAAFDRWAASMTADERRHLAPCPVVLTPSGGVHVYLRLTEAVSGCRLARTACGKCLIETRGYGHQVVAPGSPPAAHSSGRPYRLARPGWIDGG